eukprot:CAMPEP_0198284254 /NCGR_PEP_ID=MMETSP1449-20131203/3735_1 /TAXON_ID=420275 /ORGANISM="Attheya septentrionalis, Strain CCMP2084" /LENGTH=523 /DNA_ID=CAMNT_0043981233 /DNA_START=227 /DNA_END=1798 /DNA_ORIENTATION=+
MVSTRRSKRDTAETRETDITVYGATGFVARHVLEYLLATAAMEEVHTSLKITLGGRNQVKLDDIQTYLQTEFLDKAATETSKPQCCTVTLDTWIADSADAEALLAMAKRTRVVLNCAGPFQLYGTGVVKACVEGNTHYVDITGEAPWAGQMRGTLGSNNRTNTNRIISFCGFDSVPSDLAIYVAVRALKKQANGKNDNTDIQISNGTTWHAAFGLLNGGTLHTALDMPMDMSHCIYESDGKFRKVPFLVCDPLELAHPTLVKHHVSYKGWKNRLAWREWTNQLLSVDTQFRCGVSVPFLMAPVNTKVVNATAAALNYSSPNTDGKNDGFTYGERFLPLGFRATSAIGIFSFIAALFFQLILGLVFFVFKLPSLGKHLAMKLMPPGTGSPDLINEQGYGTVYAEVLTSPKKGEVQKKGTCMLQMTGDPGNLITAQCVGESALTLLWTATEDLPERSEDGFGTPMELMGSELVMRLLQSKVRNVEIKASAKDAGYQWLFYVHALFDMALATAVIKFIWNKFHTSP